MSLKRGGELARGDAFRFLSDTHVIAEVRPSSSPLACRLIPGALTAIATDGWAITIDPEHLYEVGL